MSLRRDREMRARKEAKENGNTTTSSGYQRSLRERETRIKFPEPKDININMMPFILGDINSLPEEYRHYWPMIQACCKVDHGWDKIGGELGKVCYLTIHECFVEGGKSQRRPGLHTDAHAITPGDEEYLEQSEKAPDSTVEKGKGHCFHHWGGIEGGIFVANSLDDTCCAWDCVLLDIGVLGDCEELRAD